MNYRSFKSWHKFNIPWHDGWKAGIVECVNSTIAEKILPRRWPAMAASVHSTIPSFQLPYHNTTHSFVGHLLPNSRYNRRIYFHTVHFKNIKRSSSSGMYSRGTRFKCMNDNMQTNVYCVLKSRHDHFQTISVTSTKTSRWTKYWDSLVQLPYFKSP
jgi:hypothetical protein